MVLLPLRPVRLELLLNRAKPRLPLRRCPGLPHRRSRLWQLLLLRRQQFRLPELALSKVRLPTKPGQCW